MKKVNTRQLAATGLLGAITIVLGLTPLGFIPVGPTRATIMHVPVIIGSILYGPTVGGTVGLIFGCFSLFQNIVNPTPVSFVFLNPLISVLPRVLVGVVTYYIYQAAKHMGKLLTQIILGGAGLAMSGYLLVNMYHSVQQNNMWALAINLLLLIAIIALGIIMFKQFRAFPFEAIVSSLLGSLINTTGVMGLISLLFAERFIACLGQDPTTARRAILSIGVLNGIPEAIVAMVLVAILYRILYKRIHH